MRQKMAILVIDLLEDFITGRLKCERAAAVVPSAAALLQCARKAGVPVIFCNDAHLKGIDRELALWGDHAVKGTAGAAVTSALGPEEGDYVVEKRRYSAFFHTDLDLLLGELGVETVVLIGIQAHICVQHTAADAYFLGYNVLLCTPLIEAFTEELKTSALRYMADMYATKSVSVEELTEKFRG